MFWMQAVSQLTLAQFPEIPRHVVAGWDLLLRDVCSFMLFDANLGARLACRLHSLLRCIVVIFQAVECSGLVRVWKVSCDVYLDECNGANIF